MFCGAGVAVAGKRDGHYPDVCCLEVNSKDSKQRRALAGEKCVLGYRDSGVGLQTGWKV